MKCPRCSTENSAYETRCVRCGSRFSGEHAARGFNRDFGTQAGSVRPFVVPRETPFSQVIPQAAVANSAPTDLQPGLASMEATARDWRLADQEASARKSSSPEGTPKMPPAVQPPVRPRLEVVPPGAQPSLFNPADFANKPASLRLERTDVTNGYIVPAKRKPARRRKKSDMLPFEQGTLDFLTPTSPPARQLPTNVEAAVTCDHPVASPMHRLLGAAWDGVLIFFFSIVLCGLFAGTVHTLGMDFPVTPLSLGAGIGMVLLGVGLAYHAMFALFGWDTPGSRAAGLHLVRLDGQAPTNLQRWLRLVAALVSLAAGGAGFLWILFDEEQLGWHDQVSKTFPTPRMHSESSFRKR